MEKILNQIIDGYQAELIETVQRLISFNSVYEESNDPNAPFGANIAAALEETLNIGRNMGFATNNLDGYTSIIDFGEEGKMVGILSHIDVVPAGNGWTYPPFDGEVVDGKLFGRGSVDDLDVLENEPPDPKDPLLGLDNAIITGHDAGTVIETAEYLVDEWSSMIDAYIKNEKVPSVVNREVEVLEKK